MADAMFAPSVVAAAAADRAADTTRPLRVTCTADADVTPAGTHPREDDR